MWEYRAALPLNSIEMSDVIHDGDTVKILIDLGFDVRTEKWIRLSGVSCPELSQEGGTECRAFTASWLMSRAGFAAAAERRLRWPLRIVTDMTGAAEPTERQSFTRYVGSIRDASGGGTLNDALHAFLLQHPEWPHGRAS